MRLSTFLMACLLTPVYANTLPAQVDSNQSIIYFIQPTHFFDVVFFGGALSDGIRFSGSEIYLQENHLTHYLGNAYRYREKAICAKLKPGQYTVKVYSPSASDQSKMIVRKIRVVANKVYIYALKTDLATSPNKTNITWEALPVNKGLEYVKRDSAGCPNIDGFLSKTALVDWSLKIKNHTNQPMPIELKRIGFTSIQSEVQAGSTKPLYIKNIKRENLHDYIFTISPISDFVPMTFLYSISDYSSQLKFSEGTAWGSNFVFQSNCSYSSAKNKVHLSCQVDLWPKKR